jgi:hypothetical protein
MEPSPYYENPKNEEDMFDCPGNCGYKLCSKTCRQHFKAKPSCDAAYRKQFDFEAKLPSTIQVPTTEPAITVDESSKAVASLPTHSTMLLSNKAFWRDCTAEQKLTLMDHTIHGAYYKSLFNEGEQETTIGDQDLELEEGMMIGPGEDSDGDLSNEADPYLITYGPDDCLFIPHPPCNEEEVSMDSDGNPKIKLKSPPAHVTQGVTDDERLEVRDLLRYQPLTRVDNTKLEGSRLQDVAVQEQILLLNDDITDILLRHDQYLRYKIEVEAQKTRKHRRGRKRKYPEETIPVVADINETEMLYLANTLDSVQKRLFIRKILEKQKRMDEECSSDEVSDREEGITMLTDTEIEYLDNIQNRQLVLEEKMFLRLKERQAVEPGRIPENNDTQKLPIEVDPNIERFDTVMYEAHQKYLEEFCTDEGIPIDKLGPRHTQAMKLMKILDEHGCPRVMYDKLRTWCEDSHKYHMAEEMETAGPALQASQVKDLKLPNRDDLYKTLEEHFDMGGLRPKMISHQLPKSGVKLDIATFDFQEMVRSLLTNPNIADDGNWVFPDPDDPFVPPKEWSKVESEPEAHVLNDIHQGQWYSKTYHMFCQHKGRDVLLPVILFIDKTHTDATGRLKQEPVLFTLGCFSLKTRQNPKAWRLLGYIPDMASLNITQESNDNMKDYHSMLKVILESLVKVQESGGFRWDLTIRRKKFPVVFRCFVPFVCGDNEGLNKLCGRYGSNTGIQHLCRLCKIPSEDIGATHDDIHEMFDKKSIAKIGEGRTPQEQKEISRSISHHLIKNAFESVHFGCFNEGGIHQCSPFDLLHCRRIGTQPRLCECILSAKRLDSKKIVTDIQKQQVTREKEAMKNGVAQAKRVNKSQIQFEFDIDYDETTGEGLREGETNQEQYYAVITQKLTEKEEARTKIFAPAFAKKVDRLVRYWGRVLQHQSDRTLGRTHFPHGITKNTKIAGHERPGVLLLYLVVFVSTFGSQYFETADSKTTKRKKTTEGGTKNFMSSERRADFIFCLEEELLLDHLLRSDEITLQELNSTYKEYIPMSMQRYEKTLNRRQGVGCNFLKFHWAVHIPKIVSWYGCCCGFDTETGERAHTYFCKETANQTQRRTTTLDKQGAQRVFERILVEVAHAREVPLLERLKTERHRPSKTLHRFEEAEDDDDDATVSSSLKMHMDEVLTKGYSSVLQYGSMEQEDKWNYIRPKGNKRLSKVFSWHNRDLEVKVKKFLTETVAEQISPADCNRPTYDFWNTHCVGAVRYIANPMHYVQKGSHEGWHDWALVHLDGEAFKGIEKAGLEGDMNVIHMIAFVRIKGVRKNIDQDYIQINGDGLYVVCHALERPPQLRAHAQCRLVNVGHKVCYQKWDRHSQSYMKEPQLMIVPVSAIRGPIAGIPDMEEYKPNKTDEMCFRNVGHKYFFINPKTRWLRIMRDWCEQPT